MSRRENSCALDWFHPGSISFVEIYRDFLTTPHSKIRRPPKKHCSLMGVLLDYHLLNLLAPIEVGSRRPLLTVPGSYFSLAHCIFDLSSPKDTVSPSQLLLKCFSHHDVSLSSSPKCTACSPRPKFASLLQSGANPSCTEPCALRNPALCLRRRIVLIDASNRTVLLRKPMPSSFQIRVAILPEALTPPAPCVFAVFVPRTLPFHFSFHTLWYLMLCSFSPSYSLLFFFRRS